MQKALALLVPDMATRRTGGDISEQVVSRKRKRYDKDGIIERIELLLNILSTQADWRDVDFARRAGISQPTLSHYKARRHRPDIDTIATIAERTGVSMEWLTFGSGPMWAKDLDTRGIGVGEAVLAMSSVLRDIADALKFSVVEEASGSGDRARTGIDKAIEKVLSERLDQYQPPGRVRA